MSVNNLLIFWTLSITRNKESLFLSSLNLPYSFVLKCIGWYHALKRSLIGGPCSAADISANACHKKWLYCGNTVETKQSCHIDMKWEGTNSMLNVWVDSCLSHFVGQQQLPPALSLCSALKEDTKNTFSKAENLLSIFLFSRVREAPCREANCEPQIRMQTSNERDSPVISRTSSQRLLTINRLPDYC